MISFSSQQLLPAPSCKWRKLQKAKVNVEGVRSSRRTGAAASGEGDPVLTSRGVQQARLLPTAGLGSSLPKPHSQRLTLQKAGEISPVISGNSKHPLFFAAVQTDKAVARAPNLRELGEPFLKHTIAANLTRLQLYCWLFITRKKEEKREEKKNKTKEKAFLNVGVQRKT